MKLDKTDWIYNTQYYCVAAHPENKDKMWNLYFQKEKNEMEEWGLHHY